MSDDKAELRKACEAMIRLDCFADVATAYLSLLNAQQKQEEEEPVTDEWFISVNNDSRIRRLNDNKDAFVYVCGGSVSVEIESVDRLDTEFSLPMPHVKTRRDLQQLCKFLGISLKEVK